MRSDCHPERSEGSSPDKVAIVTGAASDIGRAAAVTAAILDPVSDEASFVRGVTLPVDGGWLAV